MWLTVHRASDLSEEADHLLVQQPARAAESVAAPDVRSQRPLYRRLPVIRAHLLVQSIRKGICFYLLYYRRLFHKR